MPAPDWEGPLNSFLDTVMKSRYGSAEGKLGQQKLQLAQQKFDAENANHQADMQQRASQFGQELSLRKEEAANAQKFRQSTLDQGEAARQDASQERFRAAGGQLFNTPTDKTMSLNVNPAQAPNPASILMPKAPTQPVGPQMTQEQASMSNPAVNLPMQPPAQPPVQMTIPAEAQLPDPERYSPTVAPLGTPKGQSAYFPTLKGKVLEQRDAETEANQMAITPELAQAMPGMGLEVGGTLDRRMVPIIQKGLEYKQTMAEKATEFAETSAQRKQAEQDNVQLKMALIALKAHSDGGDVGKMYGESVMDNPDAKVPLKFQPEALKYVRDNYGMKSLPADMQASDVQPFEAAVTAINMANSLKKKLTDPLIGGNLGPIMGPMQDLTQRLGQDPRFKGNPGAIMSMQDFRSEVTGNFVNELKSINPRAAASLQGLVAKMAPNERMTSAMFEGALNGMSTVAYNRIQAVRDRQFGGKAPDSVMAKYPTPQQPIKGENPIWRKEGDSNYIGKDDSKVVNAGGKRVWIYHDGSNDKFYQLATLPPDVK